MDKRVRILIVDDEPDIGLILKLHLEDAGYETVWAEDGNAALSLMADNNTFPLVLLDVRMPGISGVEVLKKLHEEKSNAAVIMMTAHGSEYLAVECMKTGAADYISKPFVMDDMLQRVERALANRALLLQKEALEREKEEFVSMLSHDLKNPITAAIGSVDLVREGRLGPLNAEQADYLLSAIESCEEVVGMISNLLDLKRFDSNKMVTRIRPVDSSELIQGVIKKYSAAAARENITLKQSGSPDVKAIHIAVDSSMMQRVLANLVGNSLKFTYENGTIELSVSCINNSDRQKFKVPVYLDSNNLLCERQCFAKISVKDSGMGIPPAEVAQIFNSYSQSSKTGREKGGAGLGLSFCKKAVESFGGCIWAESDGENGSEFIMLLPCAPIGGKCS